MHPQRMQLFGIRIPALCRLRSGFNRRFNGSGSFFGHHFDESEFVGRIGLGSAEGGDEFGVGGGWMHKDLVV